MRSLALTSVIVSCYFYGDFSILLTSIADRQAFLLGMYHSTKNATFGLDMDYKRQYLISATYTTQTSALSNYTNGSFELNLRLSLGQKGK